MLALFRQAGFVGDAPDLGASTVCRTTPGYAPSTVSGFRSQKSLIRPPALPLEFLSQALASLPRSREIAILPRESICIADTDVLHPFFHHHFDVGPIRLTSVAHAFNYRIVVLRDDVKPAVCIGRSWRAARQFLDNFEIPWDQQVAVMFQIVCALALDMLEVLHELERLRGQISNYLVSHGGI